jgi:apolipoprotein N-acyltransferase
MNLGRRPRALVALGSGLVFAAATPPIDLHAGILLGLVGFALALEGEAPGETTRARSGALYGFCFGLGANFEALRFVPEVITRYTPLPTAGAYLALVLLAAGQAVAWAAGGAVAHRLARPWNGREDARSLAPSWLAFALGIYVATFLPAVFPWTPAGGLAPWPVLLQTADVVGERGTSLLLSLSAGLAAHGVSRVLAAKNARAGAAPFALSLAVLTVMIGWGALRMRSIEAARASAPHARVTLVQPGFDASDRWEASRAAMMIDRLTMLTKGAETRGTDLTVWPESAYPFTLSHATRTSPHGARAVLQLGIHGPVLTGVYMAGAGTGYNSAVLATSDGALSAPYDKRHLLAFGEAVPLADWFPWLRKIFAKGTGLSPGTEGVLFKTGAIRAAVLNCYEDTLPVAGREAMETGKDDGPPNLLVNITNDAWFSGSAEGELHLRLAVLRAIETRRDLVRAVNQGPTSFVDATGRVRARYDLPMPGTLPTSPALLELPPTLYTRFGDWPCALLAAASILVREIKRRQNAAGADSSRSTRRA